MQSLLWWFLRSKRLSLGVLAVAVALVLGPITAGAQFSSELPPVQVTLDVGDTVLTVEGLAPPDAFVTVLEGGSPIGTTMADGSGNFSKTFTSQTPGLHTIGIFAKANGQTSDTVFKTVNLVAQSETVLNFFLPTTLQVSSDQVVSGSPITFSGTTIPNGAVTITLNNNFQMTAAADGSGAWSHTLDTEGLHLGTHFVFAVVSDGMGNQSAPTSKRAFQVRPVDPSDDTVPPKRIEPPEITSPRNNQRFSEAELTVKGIALANSQIELWDGGSVAASAFVNHLGEWQLNIRLSEPKHELKARACVGAVCSGFSETVTVFYDSADPSTSDGELFLRLGDYRYHDQPVNKPLSLEVIFGGGKTPYVLLVDWGDSSTERLTSEDGSRQQLEHRYRQSGQYNGIVTLRDESGAVRLRYFSVSVRPSLGVPSAVVVTAAATAVAAAAAAIILTKSSYVVPMWRVVWRFVRMLLSKLLRF
jgi:hypothetical protein